MNKRMYAAPLLLAGLFVILGSCSGGSGGPAGNGALPKSLAEQYKIDGVVDLSTFPNVQQQTIDMVDSLGTGTKIGTTTLRYAIVNDERHLYIAMEWNDATLNSFEPFGQPNDFDGVIIMFDNNGNGTFDLNGCPPAGHGQLRDQLWVVVQRHP